VPEGQRTRRARLPPASLLAVRVRAFDASCEEFRGARTAESARFQKGVSNADSAVRAPLVVAFPRFAFASSPNHCFFN